MPIIEVPASASPLQQGDILRGVTLFATRETWLTGGGGAAKAPFEYGLVLSRSCVVAHKPHVVVAAVTKFSESTPKNLDSLAKVLQFLTFARDGVNAPDVYYLGQLPSLLGRYCARLDSLHTIAIPPDGELLRSFLQDKRIATLHIDFLRELHVRLFDAFARAGFADHAWLSTQDLDWLVKQGRADLAGLQQTVNQLKALQASRMAEGKQFAETELIAVQARVAELLDVVTPYEHELARRGNA